MMSSLFSIFEPCSSIFSVPLNWLSVLLGLLCLPYMYWVLPSRWVLIWTKMMGKLCDEFNLILGSSCKGGTIMFVSFFSMILYSNFLGLLPYVFTSTSHILMTLSLALPMWMCFMIFGWMNNTQNMFAHLVPLGTPSLLMPLMVMIETISNLIRPGTLAVRLMANMVAGHLLLTLLGEMGSGLVYYMLFFLIFCLILLLILEIAVAVIQSYVFAVLMTLYAGEV